MNWFRYAMETPDDGAGGGSDGGKGEGDGFVSVFNDPSRWDTPPAEPEPEEDGAEAPPPGAPAEESEPTPPAAADKPEAWSDEDWAAFQKQFPGGTEADLWKHYSNLRTKFSQGEHLQPQPEPEPEPEPEPSWMSHQFQSLGEIPSNGRISPQQATELRDLMEIAPEAAAGWAAKNSHLLTDEEFRAIQNVWYQADPYAATQAWEEARLQREREQHAEEYGPRMEVVDNQRRMAGIALVEAELPVFTEHKEAFRDWILERPQVDEMLGSLTDPEQIKNTLIGAFYQFYGPYMLTKSAAEQAAAAQAEEAAAVEAAAQAAASETANKRARTATSSAPAPPAGGEASADDIRAAIRGARH